jgi:hypothetical protein
MLDNNPAADVTPQTLLEQAKCYACFANSPSLLKLLELSILAQGVV